MKRKKTVRRNKYKGITGGAYMDGHMVATMDKRTEWEKDMAARDDADKEVASYNAKKLKDLKAAQAGLAKLEEKEDEGRKLGWRDKRRRKKWEEVEGV
jgi:hypothetical protein